MRAITGILILSVAVFAADRQIILEGARNFRDLGGYTTEDGKRVRYGRIYRSDALDKLTDADYEKLANLHIATICDLRSKVERERDATRWRGSQAPETLVLDIMATDPKSAGQDPTREFLKRVMASGATPATGARELADGMGEMALTAGPLYGKMLRRLLESDQPLLFHCTAGKDRTGMGAALLLKVLGVRQEEIEEDYLLVNKLVPTEKYAAEVAKRLEAMAGTKVDPKLLEPYMGTRREWLTGAFAAIDAKYGNFDAYRRSVLGITDAEQKRLRNSLLE